MDIRAAFNKDGFSVVNEITLEKGSRGFLAESNTAFNHGTSKKKTAMYVEGSAYEMGFLIGALVENQVAQMTGKFADTILIDFIDPNLPDWIKDPLGTILKGSCGGLLKVRVAHNPRCVQTRDAGNRSWVQTCQSENYRNI